MINGNAVESYPEVSTIRLKYVYTVPSLLTGASITLKEPTVNGTVSDAKGSVPSESKYSLHYQGWYRTQGLSAPVSGTFEDGQIYYYAALLKPETGWEFAGTASGTSGNIDSSVVNATINGKAASSIYWYNGAITTPSVADGTGWIRVYGRYVLGLEINAENFPDFKFRDYVSEYIDKDESGVLSDAERNAVTEIDIDGCDNEAYYWGIQSLEGIEHFPNLQYLYCGSPLTTLDLSGNKKLIEVRLNNDDAGGKLTSLNVKGCTALETLSLYDNQVKSLDLSTNKSLRYLFLDGNALTSLNLEENRNLETLAVGYNKSLTSLDLRLNSKLRTLSINGSGLSSIDLRTQKALEILQCENCGLTALDLKNNPALTWLYCGKNALTKLDVSKNPALTRLECQNNQLSSLDVSKNAKLKNLNCGYNQLSALDLCGCPALEVLICQGNLLKTLELSDNPSLRTLYCYGNRITELPVYMCPNLVSAFTDAKAYHYARTETINESQVSYMFHSYSYGSLAVDTEVKVVTERPPVEISSLTRSGDVFTFKLTGEVPAGAKLIAAAYEIGGRMLGAKVCDDLTVGSFTFAVPEAATVKAFLVDKNHKPLCKAKTAK